MRLKLLKIIKDFLLFSGLLRIFSPLNKSLVFTRNFNELHKFIGKHKRGLLINDFYTATRNYDKRYQLYQTVIDHYKLANKEIIYLEFGVAAASSFKWWLKANTNAQSSLYGFDTFEGLPESWGTFFKKGSMYADVPKLEDKRAVFVKGIFQDTLVPFLRQHTDELSKQKVIHLDADLFSSTIFVLSQLYPYLNKGDIIFFDEFNVANHEFFAYKVFTEAFYVKLRPIGAVNNYYQAAFIVE